MEMTKNSENWLVTWSIYHEGSVFDAADEDGAQDFYEVVHTRIFGFEPSSALISEISKSVSSAWQDRRITFKKRLLFRADKVDLERIAEDAENSAWAWMNESDGAV